MIRAHHDRLRVQGDWPITVAEVKEILPKAYRLRVDGGPRGGLFVSNRKGDRIGYAVRTMPQAREVVGYSGPTDVLVVFNKSDKVAGIGIRHSYDTPSHVDDVKLDLLFLESWNGRTWDEVAAIEDFNAAKIYTVSGATRTSEAVRESITHRLAGAEGGSVRKRGVTFGWRDAVLIGIFGLGSLFAFWKNKKFQKLRPIFSVGTIVGLGFLLGDLIAQSLLVGWVETRVPWEAAPGMVLFVGAAFLVPWFTGQPVYCQFICPHGNLQRWAMKALPARWVRTVSKEGKWIARLAPFMLMLVLLGVTFLQLDFDLAGIEPFDAYLVKSAGLATILVAVIGLSVSLLFPMAYCKYGCPTGWLLEFIRRRSGRPKFVRRDWLGLGLLVVAVILFRSPMDWFLA